MERGSAVGLRNVHVCALIDCFERGGPITGTEEVGDGKRTGLGSGQ